MVLSVLKATYLYDSFFFMCVVILIWGYHFDHYIASFDANVNSTNYIKNYFFVICEMLARITEHVVIALVCIPR